MRITCGGSRLEGQSEQGTIHATPRERSRDLATVSWVVPSATAGHLSARPSPCGRIRSPTAPHGERPRAWATAGARSMEPPCACAAAPAAAPSYTAVPRALSSPATPPGGAGMAHPHAVAPVPMRATARAVARSAPLQTNHAPAHVAPVRAPFFRQAFLIGSFSNTCSASRFFKRVHSASSSYRPGYRERSSAKTCCASGDGRFTERVPPRRFLTAASLSLSQEAGALFCAGSPLHVQSPDRGRSDSKSLPCSKWRHWQDRRRATFSEFCRSHMMFALFQLGDRAWITRM
jgi:hypothetical protein